MLGDLYAANVLPTHLWTLDLPFISEHCVQRIGKDDRQAKAPHERNGIEEISVTTAGVDPQVVERWPEQGAIEQRGCSGKGIAHDYGAPSASA